MINVQSEVITEYLTDSVNKEVTLTRPGIVKDAIDYYTGDITDENAAVPYATAATGNTGVTIMANISPWTTNYKDYIHEPIDNDWVFFRVRFTAYITRIEGSAQTTNSLVAGIQYYYDSDNPNLYRYTFRRYTRDPHNEYTYWVTVPRVEYETYIKNAWKTNVYLNCLDGTTVQAGDKIYHTNKSIAFYFTPENFDTGLAWEASPDFDSLTPDDFTYSIDNDNLVYEDFSLTESLCSRDNIKFGLCEAAHIEFSEVGVNEIGVGDRLNASINIPSYPHRDMTPAELFKINWCKSETSDPLSVSAGFDPYYELEFDEVANHGASFLPYKDILSLKGHRVVMSVKMKVELDPISVDPLPAQMGVFFDQVFMDGSVRSSSMIFNTSEFSDYKEVVTYSELFTDTVTHSDNPFWMVKGVKCVGVLFRDSQGQVIPSGTQTVNAHFYFKEVQYHVAGIGEMPPAPAYDEDDCYVARRELDSYIQSCVGGADIPLGVFKVSSVSNEYKHNIIRKKITAYDNLLALEDNAADWYTRYMFGVDFYGYTDNGLEFARQIFSSYWNYVESVGLDSIDNYDLMIIAQPSTSHFIVDPNNCYGYVRWDLSPGNTFYRTYGAVEYVVPDNTLLYRVTYDNYNGLTDEQIMQMYNSYYVESGFDTMLRGFGTIGGVLIEEYKQGTAEPINRICVNRGDFFMLSPDTTSIKVILPSGSKNALGYSLCQNVKIEAAPRRQDLTNGHLRLCYYNYDQKTIFACDSSITGRDVVRSLLEVCGCFFRLDRYNGLPEFVYPTKGGLYPSNTLYPADDLYPRTGTDQLYSMGKYISVIAENYEVKNYGRIQILKKIKSSDTQSVVEWQYEGDPDMENTYIIDDNIFYCAEEMEYDYDGMPEVAAMLEGMWGVISNLGYFPNVTQALGAPWLECGDRVGLLTYDGGFETFVFRRTLKGIQNLRDTYESEGDEITPAISNFGYTV